MRDEENQKSPKQSKDARSMNVQRFLRKRWMLPAIYLGSAAIVLAAAFYFMQPDNDANLVPNSQGGTSNNGTAHEQDVIPVTGLNEVVKMPYSDEHVEVIVPFYSEEAPEKEKQAALVYFNNFYYPNKGISLAKESGGSFEIVASLTGTVTEAKKDSTLGYIVELDHGHGITTHYQSLDNLQVEIGSVVKQGDVIGYASNNLYNKEAGTHLYFELRTDGVAVNPVDFFNQPLESLVPKADKEQDGGQDDTKEDEGEQDKDEDSNKGEEINQAS